MGNPPTQRMRAGSPFVRQIDTFRNIREIHVCLRIICAVGHWEVEYSRLTVRQVGMESTHTCMWVDVGTSATTRQAEVREHRRARVGEFSRSKPPRIASERV